MSRVISTSENSSRPDSSMDRAPTCEMTSTPGGMQTKEKRQNRTNPPQVFVALDVQEAFLSSSSSSSSSLSSSSSQAILPIGVKQLEHTPRLDECVARILSEMKDVKEPSPSFRTTRIRGGNNNRNGLVSALRLYPIQESLVRYISMKDLEAIACTSSALSNSLNLKETREMWETKVRNGRGDKARKAARREEGCEARGILQGSREYA